PYPQVWSRFDGTLRQIKPTTQFCALPGRKLVDHVLSSPSDKGLVTLYSLRSFRHRYGARHCSSLSPKESSGCFSHRPIVFSPSIQYLPIWQNFPSPRLVFQPDRSGARRQSSTQDGRRFITLLGGAAA